jgi:hypothetical protein
MRQKIFLRFTRQAGDRPARPVRMESAATPANSRAGGLSAHRPYPAKGHVTLLKSVGFMAGPLVREAGTGGDGRSVAGQRSGARGGGRMRKTP